MEESKAEITLTDKQYALKFLGVTKGKFLQKCNQCGEEKDYHINRVYAKARRIPLMLIWSISIIVAVVLASHIYNTYEVDGRLISSKFLVVHFSSMLLPITLGGLIIYHCL